MFFSSSSLYATLAKRIYRVIDGCFHRTWLFCPLHRSWSWSFKAKIRQHHHIFIFKHDVTKVASAKQIHLLSAIFFAYNCYFFLFFLFSSQIFIASREHTLKITNVSNSRLSLFLLFYRSWRLVIFFLFNYHKAASFLSYISQALFWFWCFCWLLLDLYRLFFFRLSFRFFL